MLPDFIIEQQQPREQPRLELPLPAPIATPIQKEDEDKNRGVIVIDLFG